MRFCDLCGQKDAYHDVLSLDICGECAPGIKNVLLAGKSRLDRDVESKMEVIRRYENSRSIRNNDSSDAT